MGAHRRGGKGTPAQRQEPRSGMRNSVDTRLLRWLALFVLSGVGGLVFQVVWTRQLALMLGSTIWSASLTSAAFMLGLGVGAYLMGRRAASIRHPLLRFAQLELLIAGLGILTTAGIPHLHSIVSALLTPESILYRPLLVSIALIFLITPALCMGATLPLLVSAHVRNSSRFTRVLSFFYAANTLGAALGAFATDFVFVKLYGVWGTACLAGGLDVTVGVLAYLASWRDGSASIAPVSESTAQPEPGSKKMSPLPLFLLGLCGLCGLGLEIAWTRLLVFFNGTDIYAYSLVLSTYLLGIVVGSLLVGWIPKRWLGMPLLGLLFLGLGILAWQSIYTLGLVGEFVGTWAGGHSRFLRRIIACGILILPSTIILGAMFPVATTLCHNNSEHSAGESVGLAYVWNTVGSVTGALLAGFVLLTHHGLQATIQGFGSIALLAAVLAFSFPRSSRFRLLSASMAACALTLLWIMVPNYLVPFIYDRNNDRLLFAADDHYGAVALVQQFDPAEARWYNNLLVDGYNMAGNNLEGQRYAAQLGLLPALLAEQPKDVLVICLGLSNTLRAVEGLPSVQRIDCVELSSTVIQAVSQIQDVKTVLESPKVHLQIGDGRYHLSTTSRRYDVITAEPPPPTQAGIVNLYSREYYRLCADRLNPGGVVAQWLPVMQMSQFEAKTIIRAFQDVFPYTYLYQGAGLQLVLVGSSQALPPRLENRDMPASRERLKAVDLDSIEEVFATFIAGPEELRQYVQGVPALTDNRPYLQYHDADWAPDHEFILQAEQREVGVIYDREPSTSREQQDRFQQARRIFQVRNLYQWASTGDTYLDHLFQAELAKELLSTSKSEYDLVKLGATPEHAELLRGAPETWEREIRLARWGYLTGNGTELERSLGSAERLATNPKERTFVTVYRLLLLDELLATSQKQALRKIALQGDLSEPLRAFVLRRWPE